MKFTLTAVAVAVAASAAVDARASASNSLFGVARQTSSSFRQQKNGIILHHSNPWSIANSIP